MSITLYTPSTGFPDLEAKIAYGLVRVGIEAYGVEKVKIIPEKGFYVISIEGEVEELTKTFNTTVRRILMSDHIPRNTPGITGRSAATIQVKDSENFDIDIYTNIVEVAEHKEAEKFCKHRVKGKVSNVLGFTASATTGVLCKRDGIDITFYNNRPRRPTDPRDICKTCGLLALLGTWFASFVFNVGNREIIAIPLPKEEISGSELQEIFALQHQIRKKWINQEIPQVLIPLIFFSKIPSSADILEGFDLFVAVLSRQQGYHVDGLFLIPIENYLDFIRRTPYNIATIDAILRREAFSSLQELNDAVYNGNKTSLPKFARLYIQETSTNNFTNLLYPETSKYLLREVAMISSEIIENLALGSLARTLRYFIREKKYGYTDDIRNARKESKDFEETIAKMLREGRLRLEQKEMIHLPTDEEMKEVFRLANDDFDKTKTALVILAFSFPTKTEEGVFESIEEVQND